MGDSSNIKPSRKKWCFVPKCTNTSINNPEKTFISVPNNLQKKKRWFSAVRRELKEVSIKTHFYCCEDHFKLDEDMENYLEYKLSKVNIRMKPEVLPHIFPCQLDKKVSVPRQSSEKRARKRKISEILQEAAIPAVPEAMSETRPENISNDPEPEPSTSSMITENIPGKSDFCCQAKPLRYRSKHIQVNLDKEIIEGKMCKNMATSPINFHVPAIPRKKVKGLSIQHFDSNSSISSSIDNEVPAENLDVWEPGQGSNENDSSEKDDKLREDKQALQNKKIEFRKMFIDVIETKLRMYTGIPKENKNILDVLEKKSLLKKHFIYLALYKIKTNDSFEKIGDLFGVSKTYASKIFQRTLITLAHLMKKMIFWPSELSIKKNLPIQFRITFSKVQSIIDCLEIEIQKPSSAHQQALTWSDYKKCNTIKYLISSTPDGLINFVSKGYGGRTSDIVIFENCGFLDILPENSVVMADRGFKKIETLLFKKKCSLVRPPSVANNEQMTKDDVLLTKRIASVRIHIERIIKRVRDFKMLSPHATINLDLVQKLDNIIIIACAIINIQQPIIKQ